MRVAALVLLAACGASARGPEPAVPADLAPGRYAVLVGIGLVQVQGPHDLAGAPGLQVSSGLGTSYVLPLADMKDPTRVRAPVSRAEAVRRVALLEDETPVTDTRPARARHVEVVRALSRGTDLEQLALLRGLYASTFAPDPWIGELERAVLPELAHVLATTPAVLATRLHAAHAKRGTFAPTAKVRPAEPDRVAPSDPWQLAGHDYLGAFTVTGESVVAGDPIYVGSRHDRPARGTTKNARIPALAGRWLCYAVGEDAFVVAHESARAELAGAHDGPAIARLWVDSGQMAVVDAAIRDDAAFDDARLFGADDFGVIGGRGCKTPQGPGDGTYATRVVERNGKAVVVRVDFGDEPPPR